MGLVNSKSGLERRSAALRRSQRKTITESQSKIQKIRNDIKKLKSVEEDKKYCDIKNRIELLRRELNKSGSSLAADLKLRYKDVTNTLKQLDESLVAKLKSNREEIEEKRKLAEEKKKADEEKKKIEDEKKKTEEETTPTVDEPSETVAEPSGAVFVEDLQAKKEDDAVERRKSTVSVKFVQFAEEPTVRRSVAVDEQQELPQSPRVLKMGGVAVMPGSMQEITNRSNRISEQYKTEQAKKLNDSQIEKIIFDYIERLKLIEEEISEFIGQKNGKHYNRFKDELNKLLASLTQLEPHDEHIKENLKLCKSFVGSCLSFLEEKALPEDSSESDEVFVNNNSGYLKSTVV